MQINFQSSLTIFTKGADIFGHDCIYSICILLAEIFKAKSCITFRSPF